MNVLFDTNVLIAALVTLHPHHTGCRVWMEAAIHGRIQLVVSCHSLAEFYRVLTSMKASPQFTTRQVWQLLSDPILRVGTIVELTQADYLDCLQHLVTSHARGGIVFDALIVQAALKAKVDKLLTLNDKHFLQLWPDHTDEVISPLTTQVP